MKTKYCFDTKDIPKRSTCYQRIEISTKPSYLQHEKKKSPEIPLSPILSNMYMEFFEARLLSNTFLLKQNDSGILMSYVCGLTMTTWIFSFPDCIVQFYRLISHLILSLSVPCFSWIVVFTNKITDLGSAYTENQ